MTKTEKIEGVGQKSAHEDVTGDPSRLSAIGTEFAVKPSFVRVARDTPAI